MIRPPLERLTMVEVRKMTDTRSGRWLLFIIGLTAVALVVLVITVGADGDRTYAEMVSASQTGVAFLLPILGILSVTSEWSQRTALTTFALVPERHRVANAKLLAAGAIAAAMVLAGALITAVGRLSAQVFDRADGTWVVPGGLLTTLWIAAMLGVFGGVAFGMIFLNAPLAIVAYIAIPTIWSILGESIAALEDAARWLDIGQATEPLYESGVTRQEWAHLATSSAVWVLLPVLIGVIRIARAEVK